MTASPVPDSRLRAVNEAPVNEDGTHVLYWMIAARRTRWNFGLQRAREQAERLGVPLLVFEPLRAGYPWVSPRIHRFVMDGMVDNKERCADAGVPYVAWLEPEAGDGKGLLAALAESACLVVTDEFPCFFLPRMVEAAGEELEVRLEAVDANGVVPLQATPKAFSRAFDFRRWFQKSGWPYLEPEGRPVEEPLAGYEGGGSVQALVGKALEKWPGLSLETTDEELAERFGDEVMPVETRGGSVAGEGRMRTFVHKELSDYVERNHPDDDAGSGLSPYLHFGHVSAHEVASLVVDGGGWEGPPDGMEAKGKRAGWWGLSEAREGFLDELVTWREVGYTFCHHEPEYDQFESLPDWARTTMDEHRRDDRPGTYTLEQLEQAKTGDPVWNAAQRQLVVEGRIHNYLRMLWGKRIYEWSESPEQAWERLEQLNNKWCIDGRNPNSYSGIGWVLGRFDRAWGPERPIYGKLRYMTSDSAKRKLRMSEYLEKWGKKAQGSLF